MVRGTTPQLTFELPIDLSNAAEVWLTFSQENREIFTLTKNEMTFLGKKMICKLNQKQTLSFDDGKRVEMQIRVAFGIEKQRDALVSNIIATSVERILKDGEI